MNIPVKGVEAAPDWKTIVAKWRASPFHFVLEALFHMREEDWRPWQPGSPRIMAHSGGPELWQGNFLKDVGRAAIEGKRRFSVRAGHGVGKSTVEAWLILWFVLFYRGLKVPVTANSQDQLRDVVWAEISRWHKELPPFLKDMIDITAERVVAKADPEGAFAVARTARPEKPEALQGFHAETLAFFIEEASGIEDIIFETAGGALSSDHSWVFMFANPTRTSGYFYRSHHGNRDSWRTYHVPCQHSSRVSDTYAQEMAREFGEASNTYRVRVLGEFPLSEDDSIVPLGWVQSAVDREISLTDASVVWGLDVARFGDDTSCLVKRQGPVMLEASREWKKLDLMQLCGIISTEYRLTPLEMKPSSINIDVIGLGAGVVDRLREMGLPARGVNVGESPSTDDGRYMRLRDELWFKVREWFGTRAVRIPKDEPLIAELVVPKYKIESSGKIKAESKDELKKRGEKSPNRADALCLTFAGSDLRVEHRRPVSMVSYDPFQVGTAEFERQIRQERSGHDWSPFG